MHIAPVIAIGSSALLACALAGFWRPYLSKPLGTFDGYTHLHAVLGGSWLLLLVAQALLVHRRAIAGHRALGSASYVLAPAFVVSGVLLAHHRFSRMDELMFTQEGFSLYLPIVMAGLFALAYSLAIVHRRNVQLHSRLMASTALPLIDPVFVRIMVFHLPELPSPWLYQGATFTFTAFLAYLLLRSLPTGTLNRPVFGSFVVVLLVALVGWFISPHVEPWLAFAAWFRALPLT